MKIVKVLSLFVALLLSSAVAFAQEEIVLDATTNGTTKDCSAGGFLLQDDGGGDANYTAGHDWNVIFTANCGSSTTTLVIEVMDIDILPCDTLFIYDGPNTSSPVLCASNNNNDVAGQLFIASTMNTSGQLCVRFKSAASSACSPGFSLVASCRTPCIFSHPVLDSVFYKARNGVIYDTMIIGTYFQKDTVWEYNEINRPDTSYNDTTGFHLVEIPFTGLNLCEGDSLIIMCHGDYASTGNGFYNPSDRSSTFTWDFADGDVITFAGATRVGHKYKNIGCFDLGLTMADLMGCETTQPAGIRIRIAQMPIKTIYDLATICNTDSLLVNVGFEGDGATLTLREIEFARSASKTNPALTFIPDGRLCVDAGYSQSTCFEAPVTFNEFPNSATITSKNDICSICIEYEHSYMSDYSLAVKCPSGNRAVLKYGIPGDGSGNTDGTVPDSMRSGCTHCSGMHSGGGTYTGVPYGGRNDSDYDGRGGHNCDEAANMYGVGWEYCWSRNPDYSLVTGERCDIHDSRTDHNADRYIAGPQYIDQVTNFVFDPIPAPFNDAGHTAATSSFTSKHPSNHDGKTDYYLPTDDFSSLVGCPLNGDWVVQVCDNFRSDNGWVFSWTMDICGISTSGSCEYQVGIDSILWVPDSAYGDFNTGKWRGATLWKRDSVNTYIASPDTAGMFPIHVKIYDEFACVWDTLTRITTVWNPMPDLGDDINLCHVETVTLDATDRTTPFTNQTYMWEPYADSTGIITTHEGTVNSSVLYMVEVTNTQNDIRCRARDSIRINYFPSPIPNFDPGIYPLEGCEPFTIKFENATMYGNQYRWEFGDGEVSDKESPIHTYSTGRYGLKYYVTSAEGCKDSLIYDDLITVFSSPVAKFSWDPINPTVLHPTVQFINMTEPMEDRNKYYWEIQYNKDNNLSYHTLRDINPSFTWTTSGEDISGTYIARLIAKTDERGPSGNVLECRDTVENTILLVNDFLQFPNVITANGDGINDVFEIKNLINGLGYPNNSLAIYNRWGKRVYYKVNISSEDDFWDPAKENIPAGTYFWRFSGKGYLGNIERNGTVEVLTK